MGRSRSVREAAWRVSGCALVFVLAASCHKRAEETGTTRAQLSTNQTIQLTFPKGVDSGKVALAAMSGALSIEDRSVIQESNGALTLVSAP